MSNEEIFAKVKSILSEQLGVDADTIEMDSDFIDDLNADSLDIVDLVLDLENEFDVTIPDEEAERIKTVGDAVEFIKETL